MAREKNPEEKSGSREAYGDIIDLPRWEPNSRHPRMILHDRAAQFAPFAALVGYDEMVEEEIRQTEDRIELGGDQADRLNRRLCVVSDALAAGKHPELTFTFFVPDMKKAGGRYVSVDARVRRIDPAAGRLYLMADGQRDIPEFIRIDRLIAVSGPRMDGLEESGIL